MTRSYLFNYESYYNGLMTDLGLNGRKEWAKSGKGEREVEANLLKTKVAIFH